MKKTTLLLIFMLFTGCLQRPTKEQIAKADCGAYPPANYRAITQEFIGAMLKDPYSAQYEISAPERGYILYPSGGTGGYGWIVYVDVNAKNSYGGYGGYRRCAVLFRGAKITAWATDELWLTR